MKEIYFDHSATTAVKREVLNEMIPYFNLEYGNPSSLYYIGREAKRAIECARRKVARAINCCEEEVYFTSCGSESDNLAIKGFAYANRCRGNHIITSKIEHPAVLNTCKNLEHKGFRVTYLNVDENGFIDINQLKRNICNDTILISIMMANNELGTIQNIQEIGKIAHRNNIVFHTDAVQAVGNIKIDVQSMNVDMLSMSAHKFYGPKGVGALYVRKGINFERIQDGGHQEKNKRSGTENVAGIVGLGKAIEIATYNIDRYNKKLLALLNIGKKAYFFEDINDLEILNFAKSYGLLGFMADFPINKYYILEDEVIFRDYNFSEAKEYISTMKVEEYLETFMPRINKREMKKIIDECRKQIHSCDSEKNIITNMNEKLIYSINYGESVDLIIYYARDLYKALYELIDSKYTVKFPALSNIHHLATNIDGLSNAEIELNVFNLKQVIDLAFSIQLAQDVRLLKICNFCNNAFIANNPKAEYDTPQCKNKANVYKSRGKHLSRNVVHTENGIAVKIPSQELSDSLIKRLKKK